MLAAPGTAGVHARPVPGLRGWQHSGSFPSRELARTDLFPTGMIYRGQIQLKFAQGVKALSSALRISHHSPMHT